MTRTVTASTLDGRQIKIRVAAIDYIAEPDGSTYGVARGRKAGCLVIVRGLEVPVRESYNDMAHWLETGE
jgi:hypothetical protein